MWECSDGQTDIQTDTDIQTAVATIHFASAMPHTKCNKSVLVLVAVSKLGCANLIFVEPGAKKSTGAKVNYRDELLMQELLSVIYRIARDVFVFQQDNAPAHRARDTVEILRRETSFINHDMWPANRPDLNRVDYRIWTVIQQHVSQVQSRELTRCGNDLLRRAERQHCVADDAVDSGV